MAKVMNISDGPRGAYLDGALVMAEVSQVIEADDFNDEWFGPARSAPKVEAKDEPKADAKK